jgi:surfactin synthase thioesterase subunit
VERLGAVRSSLTERAGRGRLRPARTSAGIELRRLTGSGGGTPVFLVPAAGAGPGAYRSWGAGAPPGFDVVAVHLPGREERAAEEPYTQVSLLAEHIADRIAAHTDRPSIVLGHGAGAHIGREVAKRLLPAAVRMLAVVAAAPPDTIPADCAAMGDDELMAWCDVPATAPGDPIARSALISRLRGDLAVLASCRATLAETERLDIPTLAFAGAGDGPVPFDRCVPWADWTTSRFELHQLPGLRRSTAPSAEKILSIVARFLENMSPRPAAAR